MPLKSQRELILACLLASTAGYVDAVGFLDLGGFFVSFMSGNTTRMAAETTTSHIAGAGKALGLIGLFFVGSVAGGLLARYRDGRVSVLVGTSTLVGIAAIATTQPWLPVPAVLIAAVAMGMLNATFVHDGQVSVPVTYVTGSLVKAGHQVANALLGGPRWDWARPALIWASLACGALLGGSLYSAMGGMPALWPALAALIALTLITWRVRHSNAIPTATADPAT